MISRGLMRRLERLEARLDPNLRPRIHVEFYEMDQNGKLIRLASPAHLADPDQGIEERFRIRVVYVDAAEGRPITEQTRNAAPAAMR